MEEESAGVDDLPKVLISVPSMGQMHSAFIESMYKALIGSGEIYTGEYIWLNGYITDEARNVSVEKAIELEFDFVFFMDSDMIFPKGALLTLMRHLLSHPDKPRVVGGLYNTRSDHRMNTYMWDEKLKSFHSVNLPLNNGLKEIDCVATGCMLCDINVFKSYDWPWFEYFYNTRVDGSRERWSEDMVFGHRCMELGIKHYADTDVVCEHIINARVAQVEQENYEVRHITGYKY